MQHTGFNERSSTYEFIIYLKASIGFVEDRKWWGDMREWTGLDFPESQRAVEDRDGGSWFRDHWWCPYDRLGQGTDR